MKKLSLWLNVVLIIAVAGIYFLHFTGNKTTKHELSEDSTEHVIDRDYAIAYVNIDTLVRNYKSFVDKSEKLTQKKDESEAELQIQSKNFENEVRDFQDKTSKGLITRTKAQMLQQELAQKEQQLYAMRDNLAMQLSEEEQVMYRQVLSEVMDFLEVYNKDYSYKYIFSNSFGGQLLFTDKSLNITNDVLIGLNEFYEKEKE
ncbi:MAG: OmpH family outer membrane protein [Bacteroidales bacterium]|jgi:outer membrane protein|nr:OmpH family outer membrane protein [Bacteroidales bacterium]